MTQELKMTGDLCIASKHHGKQIVYDARWMTNAKGKPIILFVHGFKGFKDWGPFNQMADVLAASGLCAVKMNLSHNGTSQDSPTDFVDLEAFGLNNFSIELDDMGVLIDHLLGKDSPLPTQEVDISRLYLMGHSRGGGLCILKAREDSRVNALVTLAAISDLADRWDQKVLDQWEKDGVMHISNSRTGQVLPMYFQMVEDYHANEERLNIPAATATINIPWLAFHGNADETLPVAMARDLQRRNPDVDLRILQGAGHTFGAKHPWNESVLSGDFEKVVLGTAKFLGELTQVS